MSKIIFCCDRFSGKQTKIAQHDNLEEGHYRWGVGGCRDRWGRQRRYGSGKVFLERHLNWNVRKSPATKDLAKKKKKILQKRLPSIGYSRCKGPEAGISLVCSVKIRNASVTRVMWVRRRVGQ